MVPPIIEDDLHREFIKEGNRQKQCLLEKVKAKLDKKAEENEIIDDISFNSYGDEGDKDDNSLLSPVGRGRDEDLMSQRKFNE